MGRKTVLTKEQIIECAFELSSREGISNITIRNIAKELNTSTAPIYTQYANRDMILNDLDGYIVEKLEMSINEARTINPFFNIGIGIIDFVLKNQKVVSEFYFTLNRLSFNFEGGSLDYIDKMKDDKYLSVLPKEILEKLLEDMRIYTFGLVATICTEPDQVQDLAYYYGLLEDLGGKLTNYYLSQVSESKTCQHVESHKEFNKKGGEK